MILSLDLIAGREFLAGVVGSLSFLMMKNNFVPPLFDIGIDRLTSFVDTMTSFSEYIDTRKPDQKEREKEVIIIHASCTR
jgi:hypothetical protein